MNRKTTYVVIGVAILALIIAFFIFDSRREVLAKVNDVEITRTQLELKLKVMNIYRSDIENQASEFEAFAELLKEAKDEAIFIQLTGVPIEQEQLNIVAQRVSEQTLAAGTLAKIQKALGGAGSDTYLNIVIRPRFVNTQLTRLLAEKVAGNEAEKRRMAEAKEFIERARSGDDFATLQFGAYYQTTIAPPGYGIPQETGEIQYLFPIFEEPTLTALRQRLKSSVVGDVLESPYRLRGGYSAVKVEEINGELYELGVVFVQPKNVQELYEEEKMMLELNIMSKKFKRALQNT